MVNKLPKQKGKQPQKETPPNDMPFFRMTSENGTTGILRVVKDSKGNWMIPDPEIRRRFFEQTARPSK